MLEHEHPKEEMQGAGVAGAQYLSRPHCAGLGAAEGVALEWGTQCYG